MLEVRHSARITLKRGYEGSNRGEKERRLSQGWFLRLSYLKHGVFEHVRARYGELALEAYTHGRARAVSRIKVVGGRAKRAAGAIAQVMLARIASQVLVHQYFLHKSHRLRVDTEGGQNSESQ